MKNNIALIGAGWFILAPRAYARLQSQLIYNLAAAFVHIKMIPHVSGIIDSQFSKLLSTLLQSFERVWNRCMNKCGQEIKDELKKKIDIHLSFVLRLTLLQRCSQCVCVGVQMQMLL